MSQVMQSGLCRLLKAWVEDERKAEADYGTTAIDLEKRTTDVKQWVKDGVINERQADILSGLLTALSADEGKHGKLLRETWDATCGLKDRTDTIKDMSGRRKITRF